MSSASNHRKRSHRSQKMRYEARNRRQLKAMNYQARKKKQEPWWKWGKRFFRNEGGNT